MPLNPPPAEKRKIQAQVSFPVQVEIEEIEGEDSAATQDRIIAAADKILNTTTIKGVITDSNTHPELID